MEHQKILNLLNKAGYSKFVTRKWNIVNDELNANYDVGNETIYNTEVLKSNLSNCSDACILVKGDITIAGNIAACITSLNASQKLMEQQYMMLKTS